MDEPADGPELFSPAIAYELAAMILRDEREYAEALRKIHGTATAAAEWAEYKALDEWVRRHPCWLGRRVRFLT